MSASEAQRMRKFVDYDPQTGLLTWKPRQPEDFSDKCNKAAAVCMSWNKRHSGNPAFAVPTPQGYLGGFIGGNGYLAHRVAWLLSYGEWPNVVDHINANKTDNRLENLRSVDKCGNARNARMPSHNTSGAIGVSFDKKSAKWEAHVTVMKKKISLGYFAVFEDAVAARKAANTKYGFSETHGRAA